MYGIVLQTYSLTSLFLNIAFFTIKFCITDFYFQEGRDYWICSLSKFPRNCPRMIHVQYVYSFLYLNSNFKKCLSAHFFTVDLQKYA